MVRHIAVLSIAHAPAGRRVSRPAGMAAFLEKAAESKVTLFV